MVAETARANRIYLDFDQRRVPRLRPIWAVCRILQIRPGPIVMNRTRRGWHVIVSTRDRFTDAELVALQALMGSDRHREALNLHRVIAMRRQPLTDRFWRRRWNLLFAGKLQ